MRLFAGYRERVGKSQVSLELPEGADCRLHGCRSDTVLPEMTRHPERLVVAVNQEYRDHRYGLEDGDEVALIPPVSGGVA